LPRNAFDELVKRTTTKETQAKAARRAEELLAKSKKPRSTVERWMTKPGFKEAFKREYKEFLLSDLVLGLMAEDTQVSPRSGGRAGRFQNRHPESALGRANRHEAE
jgi:hypothetical protein